MQTAGTGGISAEIQAAFLKDPAQAREAIRLAVKLRHPTETAAPAQQPAMERGSRGGQGRLAQRLRRLELLAQQGVLAQVRRWAAVALRGWAGLGSSSPVARFEQLVTAPALQPDTH